MTTEKVYLAPHKHYNIFSAILNKWIVAEYIGYNCLSDYCQFKSVEQQDYKTDCNFIENIHPTVVDKYVTRK